MKVFVLATCFVLGVICDELTFPEYYTLTNGNTWGCSEQEMEDYTSPNKTPKNCFNLDNLYGDCTDVPGGYTNDMKNQCRRWCCALHNHPADNGDESLASVTESATFTLSTGSSGVEGPPAGMMKRIVGGNSVSASVAPYFGQIGTKSGAFFCGGAVVGRHWILTAAHCFQWTKALVTLGSTDKEFGNEASEQVMKIDKIIKHPDYNDAADLNDIALLHTVYPIVYNDNVKPVSLCGSIAESGTTAVICGMGADAYDGTATPDLRCADMTTEHTVECDDIYNNYRANSSICYGKNSPNNNGCVGDSGGPVVISNPESPDKACLLALHRGSNDCGENNHPSYGESIPYATEWILKTIAEFE